MFLVVCNKVLDRSDNPCALDAIYHRCCAIAGQYWILGERLKSATTKRTSLHVDRGTEQDGCSLGLGFFSHHGPCFEKQGHIPRGGESSAAWKACSWYAIEEPRTTDTIRAIRAADREDLQACNRFCMPEIDTCLCQNNLGRATDLVSTEAESYPAVILPESRSIFSCVLSCESTLSTSKPGI